MSLLEASFRNVQRAEARLVALQAKLDQLYQLPDDETRRVAVAMVRLDIKRGIEDLQFHAVCLETNRRWMGTPSPWNG